MKPDCYCYVFYQKAHSILSTHLKRLVELLGEHFSVLRANYIKLVLFALISVDPSVAEEPSRNQTPNDCVALENNIFQMLRTVRHYDLLLGLIFLETSYRYEDHRLLLSRKLNDHFQKEPAV